jgi:hypothetical protein
MFSLFWSQNGRLYDEAVGDVATCGLRAPNNLDHMAAFQAVVARHRVRHLDARQQRVLQTAAVSESSIESKAS